jgi:hypothetical protein
LATASCISRPKTENTEAPAPVLKISPDSSSLPRLSTPTEYNLETLGEIVEPISKSDVRLSSGKDLTATGWAVDVVAGSPAAGVNIVIDGKHYQMSYGASRMDVSKHFNVEAFNYSGFSGSIPSAALTPGKHSLSVQVINRNGTGAYEGKQSSFEVK